MAYDTGEDGPSCNWKCEASGKMHSLEEISEHIHNVKFINEARALHAEAEELEAWLAKNGECTCEEEAEAGVPDTLEDLYE